MWIRQLISEKIFRLKLRSETRQYCYFELTCRCNDLYEANTLLSFWIEPLCYFLALLVTCRQPRSSWLNFLISDLDLPSCCQRNMEAWWWETAKRWQRQHRLKDNIFSYADKEQTETRYQISYHPNMTSKRGSFGLLQCSELMKRRLMENFRLQRSANVGSQGVGVPGANFHQHSTLMMQKSML